MSSSIKSEILESLGKNLPGLIFYRFIRRKGGNLICDYISDSIYQLIGETAENVKQNPSILRTCVLPQYLEKIKEATERSFRTHCDFEIEVEIASKNDGIRWMRVVCIPEKLPNDDVIWFGIQTDITTEKITQSKLSKFNHELKLLNNIYDIIITNNEEQKIYDLICECLVSKGGYKLAWIAHRPDLNNEDQTVVSISAYGELGYLNKIKIDLNDPALRNGPTGKVLKNGGYIINNDAANNNIFSPWHETAEEFGIRSSITLELNIFNDRRSALNIYSPNINAFDENEALILERVAKGVSSAVKNVHIELTRNKVTEELLQRNRDLEQFAYIVSHNLRAPVANILGLNLLLNDGPSESDKELLLDKLNSSTLRLDEVIKDLNSILQIRREVSEIKTEIHFETLVNNVLESISSIVSNKNIDFNIDFSKAPKANLIRTYIGSVFFNLITNSIKYSKPNTQIKISINSIYENDKVIINYEDNGIGIDLTKYKEQVFGLYKKFNNEIEGKGLGLFMVKTQIEVMRGTISINSTVDVGTSFKITLPIN